MLKQFFAERGVNARLASCGGRSDALFTVYAADEGARTRASQACAETGLRCLRGDADNTLLLCVCPNTAAALERLALEYAQIMLPECAELSGAAIEAQARPAECAALEACFAAPGSLCHASKSLLRGSLALPAGIDADQLSLLRDALLNAEASIFRKDAHTAAEIVCRWRKAAALALRQRAGGDVLRAAAYIIIVEDNL